MSLTKQIRDMWCWFHGELFPEIEDEVGPLLKNHQRFVTWADAPYCALGLVRSGNTQIGFFAMRPESNVPANVAKMGIGFGYRILISHDLTPISQLVFGFSGFAQYSVLVNPSNPLAIKAI